MKELLHETAEAHFEDLGRHLHRLGLSESRAATADIAYLFRGVRWDPFFPRDTMLEALQRTLLRLGIDLAGQGNVEVDSEPRPRKSARAFCAGIRIPDEVKLVIKPSGAQDDYRSLFHEAGHAEHFSHVDAGLPVAFRRLGDNSVTESYAFLIEHLLMNPAWLEEMLGIEDAGGYLEYARFRKRYMLRRYASKLRYEQALHSGAEEPAPLYASFLGENLGGEDLPGAVPGRCRRRLLLRPVPPGMDLRGTASTVPRGTIRPALVRRAGGWLPPHRPVADGTGV